MAWLLGTAEDDMRVVYPLPITSSGATRLWFTTEG